MPRHPPNAQKNKQQRHTNKTKNFVAEIITVRCSRPLYSSQPTHPHPHPTTHQTGSRTRARQPGRTAPEPRQHATPHTRRGHPPTSETTTTTTAAPAHHSRRVSYTTHNQPPPQHKTAGTSQPCTLISVRDTPPPAGPDHTGPDKTNNQKRRRQTAPHKHSILRKEVIQPHLPVRLPCYDFTPLTRHTFDGSSPKVRPPASGTPGSGGVTGGVYKARERIHRSLADLRLLAIPAS